ncbi:MAG: hypothetical protein R3C14_55060 [Caldilineaceae bacterium]
MTAQPSASALAQEVGQWLHAWGDFLLAYPAAPPDDPSVNSADEIALPAAAARPDAQLTSVDGVSRATELPTAAAPPAHWVAATQRATPPVHWLALLAEHGLQWDPEGGIQAADEITPLVAKSTVAESTVAASMPDTSTTSDAIDTASPPLAAPSALRTAQESADAQVSTHHDATINPPPWFSPIHRGVAMLQAVLVMPASSEPDELHTLLAAYAPPVAPATLPIPGATNTGSGNVTAQAQSRPDLASAAPTPSAAPADAPVTVQVPIQQRTAPPLVTESTVTESTVADSIFIGRAGAVNQPATEPAHDGLTHGPQVTSAKADQRAPTARLVTRLRITPTRTADQSGTAERAEPPQVVAPAAAYTPEPLSHWPATLTQAVAVLTAAPVSPVAAPLPKTPAQGSSTAASAQVEVQRAGAAAAATAAASSPPPPAVEAALTGPIRRVTRLQFPPAQPAPATRPRVQPRDVASTAPLTPPLPSTNLDGQGFRPLPTKPAQAPAHDQPPLTTAETVAPLTVRADQPQQPLPAAIVEQIDHLEAMLARLLAHKYASEAETPAPPVSQGEAVTPAQPASPPLRQAPPVYAAPDHWPALPATPQPTAPRAARGEEVLKRRQRLVQEQRGQRWNG